MAIPAPNMAQRARGFALGPNQDIVLAMAVVAILTVLVIPIRPGILDVLLTLNISLSIVVLLGTIYLKQARDFSVFPSLLLVLTLFRLSLNVASTRLILSEAHAGQVIQVFGAFVTAGNIVVGIVIFSILLIIQFVVITRGATRISEVAARFTLDALPGKQMGVDADLNSGLISEDQARERRRNIEQEADFYGAMDGATKFVRGDAIAGLIITLVNIVGGLTVGMLQQGMGFTEAGLIYSTLTIGDGLVTQIPALVISTSAAMIVTRTTSETNLGVDLGNQLARFPRALGVAAVLLGAFALFPGMPTIPFMFWAAILGFVAFRVTQSQEVERLGLERAKAEEQARPEQEPTRAEDLLAVDPLKIELGYGLITLADPKQGGDLLTRIQMIRQQLATKLGFVVPVVRIVDNMRLRPNEYRVRLREAEIARFELMPDHFLAMNPGLVDEEVDGVPTVEPAFGLQALWVRASDRDRAERLGYTIVEPSAVVATHLTELITNHAAELLSREDVKHLVDTVKDRAQTVVDELIPNVLTLGEVQKVLQNLLLERVTIRNLELILETMADFGPRTKDPELLTEYCRHALARQISAEYADEENVLRVITLAPALEQEILEAVRQSDTGDWIPLAPARIEEIGQAMTDALQPLVMSGHDPVLITSAQIRRYIRRLIVRVLPKAVVLSFNEIDPSVKLESEGQVSA